MDTLKHYVLAKVGQALRSAFEAYYEFEGATEIEVHVISPSELEISMKPEGHGPRRFFKVKTSEMM